MQNEALQAALALYHAPNERFSLARAELPRDIGFALRLASAPQPLLQEAAAELGESEDVLLEAIRFYLQLMLFQPEANAYRVLGLAPDAPQNRIREHHRWLQRWLHPDRRGEDWTLYAPRVNWAWNQLHNERSRHEYDVEQVAYRAEDGVGVLPEHPRVRPDWMHPAATRERMTLGQRLGLAVLIGGCGVLLYLASTRQDTPPADVLTRTVAAEKTEAAMPPQAAPDNGPTLAQVRKAMEQQAAAQAAQPSTDAPVPHADAPPATTRAPTPVSDEPPPPPRTKSEPALAHNAAAARASETPPAENPRATAATTAPAPVVPAAPDTAPARPAATPPSAPTVLLASAAAPAHVLPDATALARARLASGRVQQLSQFFGAPDQNVPPIWNDAQGQSAAERERHRLRERVGWDGPGDFSVETPVWRLSENLAALDAAYRVRKGQSVSESGRLSLRMVWREEMWLVTQVALVPAQ